MTAKQQNWAGNYTYHAARFHEPETIEQLQELVRQSANVKVLGSRHSFNSIADTTADHISLAKMEPSVTFDHERHTVTVAGGVVYGRLGLEVHRAGYALHNMGSLPHISVAGACATGTHGSGDNNGNLATAVSALELVTANGDIVSLSCEDEDDRFAGAVVGLGGLGVVTKLTLDTVPTFYVQQEVYDNLPLTQLDAHFDEIASHAYSVSLFTDWHSERVSQVWLKRKLENDTGLALAPTFFEATLAPNQRHPITVMSGDPCTVQMGVPGAWHERLPHFRMDQTPSNGEEIQSEYFVLREHAVDAMRAITQIHDQIKDILMISEIRTVAADDLWMSPCYGQACVGVHFTWKLDTPAVQRLLPLVEQQLAPFNPRPHWGKVFTLSPAYVQAQYTKLPDFQNLLRSFDPNGKFRNNFLDTYIFEAS